MQSIADINYWSMNYNSYSLTLAVLNFHSDFQFVSLEELCLSIFTLNLYSDFVFLQKEMPFNLLALIAIHPVFDLYCT